MHKPDDLEQLWKTQPADTAIKGEEMRDIVLKKMKAFDRTIRVRNMMESIVAVAVAGFFAYAAWIQRNGMERIGSVIIVAGALWIVYYIRRHGTETADPPPDQTVADYRRALVLKYEHQIRLLRSVKFWYLLPLYVGLLTSSGGLLREQAARRPLTWADAIPPLAFTLIFAGVWWLNEGYAVGKLQRLHTQLISSPDQQSLS